jgi:hypothetical protein
MRQFSMRAEAGSRLQQFALPVESREDAIGCWEMDRTCD